MTGDISGEDRAALQTAKALLENPGVAARMTNVIGKPIEDGIARLPANWSGAIDKATRLALTKAADAALFTLTDRPGMVASSRWHKLAVSVTGGVGGAFGWAGLALELPVSTTLILRSIADIARSEGESVAAAPTRLACLSVLALGGSSRSDDGTDSGYYAVRAALAQAVSDAAQYLAQSAGANASAPVLARLISAVAKRFGVQVGEKAAAEALPLVGAVGGATINLLFIDHFQDMARGHFTVRRLERRYGEEAVQALYATLPAAR